MSKFIVLLGRNTEGIIKDVKKEFGETVDILVITRNNDSLNPPENYPSVSISEFKPEHSYIVIANGGTTAQLIPLIKTLVENNSTFEVWDLQRDGKPRLLW